MKYIIICLSASFYLMTCFCLNAQETISVTRINDQLTFDGIPDEPQWESLNKFDLIMHRPTFGLAPSEVSEVRVGYDNEFLWIGAKLFMKETSKIFSPTMRRDEELDEYDAFGVILDTYDDNENALAFFTNPAGLRTDYTISGDGEGGGGGPNNSLNTSWNTFWDVKTTVDDKGWYVEMRIPFSSMKFKPVGDIATMGLILVRNISANNETDSYPAIDPKYGHDATNKPSLAVNINFHGARPKKPVYISPYVIGGFSQDWYLNDEGTEYLKNRNYPAYTGNAGVDVKYNINSNLTLDLTANTDFAQVEADDQQVNLTRYSLFFPEKRMFFQERASLFDFALGNRSDNLFYSRNIGIARREQIRILGGARLTGRIGNWDVGLINMQTDNHETTSGENFGVLRMRRQVINQNSYVGGIFTSRLGMNGDHNLAYGLDGIFRLFGVDYLNVKWAQTYDNKINNKINSFDPSFFLINWQRRSQKGFAYDLKYFYSGQEFNPGVGFVRMDGVQGVNTNLMYGWLPDGNSKFFDYGVSVQIERFSRLEDGKLESMRVAPEIKFKTKKGIRGSAGINFMEEGVLSPFQLSQDIIITAGEYSFYEFQVRFGTSDNRTISVDADFNRGKFYDGRRTGTEIEANFNLSSSFRMEAAYEFNAIRFPERIGSNSINIHSANVKMLYMLSTKLSASALVQYVNTDDEMITNFRLRFNPREGNDFYLVYNDLRGLNRNRTIITIPPFFNRTLMVKYTHTFIL